MQQKTAQTSDLNTDTCAVAPILNLYLTSEYKSENLNIYLVEKNTMKNFLKSCNLNLCQCDSLKQPNTYFVKTADVLFILVTTVHSLMRKIKEFYED